MKRLLATAALATLSAAACAGEITLFADGDFQGPRLTLRGDARDLSAAGFNDRVSSAVVRSGAWRVCEDVNFGGRCQELGPGEYRWLAFNDRASSVQEIDRWGRGSDEGRQGWGAGRGDDGRWGHRAGDDRGWRDGRDRYSERYSDSSWNQTGAAILFQDSGFRGRSVSFDQGESDLRREGFNDQASSLIVREGRWVLCEHANFGGRCFAYGPGRYPSLDLSDRVSSLRRER